jgi:hypothetical protein
MSWSAQQWSAHILVISRENRFHLLSSAFPYILTVVTTMTTVFWVVTPCSFGERYVQRDICFCSFLLWLILKSWRWLRYALSKRRTASELHSVTTQMTASFATSLRCFRTEMIFLLYNKISASLILSAPLSFVSHFLRIVIPTHLHFQHFHKEYLRNCAYQFYHSYDIIVYAFKTTNSKQTNKPITLYKH